MDADEARRLRREQRARRSRPAPRPGGGSAVYRRRRITAILALLGLAAVLAFAIRADRTDYPDFTSSELQSFERAADPIRFTVSASGDILVHSPLWAKALENGGGSTYDFSPFFSEIAPWVAGADLALCHQETPLGPPPPATFPLFNTPEELATSIEASGWDACDTASNHSLDQGEDGIASTVAAFERAGVRQTGSFTSARRRDRPTILEVDGIRLGFVAYTDYTNGIPLPEPWAVNVADDGAERVIADAKRAREAGAEAVIVNMHWGDENSTEPNQSQLELADRLTRSPAVDVVVGQGPHVVQPIRRINGKFVVFSEGNLVSNQSPAYALPAETQDGLIALLQFVADGDGIRVDRLRYLPIWVRLDDYAVLPARPSADSAYSDSLRDSYERTVAIAGSGPGFAPLPPD